VNDIAFTDDNQLAALIGYTENQSASSSTANQARSYGVALLDLGGRSGSISVGRFIDLAYSPVRCLRLQLDYRAHSYSLSMRYRRLLGSCFLRAVPWHTFNFQQPSSCFLFHRVSPCSASRAIRSPVADLSYQDVIGLKLPNAFLGSGSRQTPKKLPNQASLVLITAFGGLVSVEAFGISSRVEAE
jgi:hypothetical protein